MLENLHLKNYFTAYFREFFNYISFDSILIIQKKKIIKIVEKLNVSFSISYSTLNYLIKMIF